MNKIIVSLILSLVLFANVYSFDLPFEIQEDTGEEFGRDVDPEEINPPAQEIQFDPSNIQEDTGEEFGRNIDSEEINPPAQEIQFDPSNIQEDTGEEFGRNFTLETQTPTTPREENPNLETIEEDVVIESEKLTDNIIFIAGFGIIVIALIGITLLYSLHYFRRKRENL